MTVKTESFHAGEFLVREGNGDISREHGTLTAGQTVVDGQVLKVSAGKLVVATGSHHTDGSSDETIAGVVIGNWTVATDTVVPYIARLATVKDSAMTYSTAVGGAVAAATTAVKGALAKLFIIPR